MTDRDIIVRLATEVMGWKSADGIERDDQCCFFRPTESGKRLVCWWNSVTCSGASAWNPLESITDAYEMEAAIPEAERDAYIGYLECECVRGGFDSDSPAHEFAIVHATPRQRCLATIAMMENR